MKKRNGLVALAVLGLAEILYGCANIRDNRSNLLFYERTMDISGNRVQERFILAGRGKEAEEISRLFERVYKAKTPDKIHYRKEGNYPGENSGRKNPEKI
jgi:hypothetical protein